MKTIYEGQVIPGPPITPSGPIAIPDNILYLNIYNISPHRLTVSLSLGLPDIYFPPFYYYEGLFLGVQGGSTLTIGQDRSHARTISIVKVTADTGLSTLPGDLSIIGFRKDENWQGQRPLIAGAISPTAGAGVATSIQNTGQPPLTAIITANANGTNGNIRVNNDGSMTVQLQSLGAADTILSLANGVGVAKATIVIGDSTDQSITTFWGTLGKILADPSAPLQNIQSDGAGKLTLHQLQSNVSTISSNQNCLLLSDSVTGRTWALAITQSTGELSFFETLANKTELLLDSATGFASIGGSLKLLGGVQESRKCGGKGVAAVAGNIWGFWIPFQHVMTNAPSNVTLVQIANTNVSTETTSDINVDGFMLNLTATAAGAFSWTGTYTTVGN